MSKELEPIDRYELQGKIVDLYLKGQNPPSIAKQLKLTVNNVREHIAEFQKANSSDDQLRERSRSLLSEYDQQTNDVIKEIWTTIADADVAGELKTKATLLKSLSDIQAKRVEVVQKAGLLSDNQIVEDMAVQEEKMQILMGILREVTGKCNHCKVEVARRLSQVAGKAEPIPTVDEEGNAV